MESRRQLGNPVVVGLAVIAALFFMLPLTGLVIRAPWSSMTRVITSSSSLDALWLSLVASVATTALALAFGFPLAWLLARGRFPGKPLLRGLTTLPMVLPPVVGGIALLLAYGRKGLIGAPLNSATGLSLPFTTAGVIVAEAFVAMPFFVITVGPATVGPATVGLPAVGPAAVGPATVGPGEVGPGEPTSGPARSARSTCSATASGSRSTARRRSPPRSRRARSMTSIWIAAVNCGYQSTPRRSACTRSAH
ncbi:MAG TPA: hypothetical protein VMR14_17735 [Streptosporangiaceae bacterium]|nr:hypothetical protein [Streptosporangiaceae bacterium]